MNEKSVFWGRLLVFFERSHKLAFAGLSTSSLQSTNAT